MTSDEWLRRAILESTRPKGIVCTGLWKTKCCVYMSDQFRARNESVKDLLLALSASDKSKLTVAADAMQMVAAYDRHFHANGAKSQPWRVAIAIVGGDDDALATRQV